jgi:lantibiotic modifying enzyme
MPSGVGWLTAISGDQPLAGFSHGAAGIGWGLIKLSDLCGERRYRSMGLAAMGYERSLFLPEHGNWPDLRKNRPTQGAARTTNHMVAWCHGAAGIGLGRLGCLSYMDDGEMRTEIDIALQTTLEKGFGSNHSLCHGELGNIDCLLEAAVQFDNHDLRARVYRIAAGILEGAGNHGWLCGVPLGAETPGLMTGLAGIGYELLRLAEPTRVPSVLVLEPPKRGL